MHAMVVASELATNAVMHAHSSFTLSLAAGGGEVVRISIRDAQRPATGAVDKFRHRWPLRVAGWASWLG